MNHLTSKPPKQLWPQHALKEELAERFAEYFEQKILTIREKYTQIQQFEPYHNVNIPKLSRFTPVTQKEVELTIKTMKAKSCELDCIPTVVLKDMLLVVPPYITQIINLSLSNGIFSEKWKTAVVRPLIKKIGLDLIESNFRPVGNLSFISKLTEKCMHQIPGCNAR